MLKKVIEYTDYNDTVRKETFYFNMSKAELMEQEMGVSGGYSEMVQRITEAQDMPTLMKLIRETVLKAYGEKSADGKRFIKSPELSEAFSQTEAYSSLMMELLTDAEAAAQFVIGIMPADLAAKAKPEIDAKILEITGGEN